MTITPAQRWDAKIAGYRATCKKMLELSPSIRYAGVINGLGRTLAGVVRPGVKPLLSPEQVKDEFFIMSTLITLRKGPSAAVGALDYVVLRHKKATIVACQRGDATYYISINAKQKNIMKIISGIRRLA
ncbi:hypothetical protein CENSYa_0835 [Cenarchaeum symbiosum A]|uniref:Profilin n=1 Tax=Cenarchaeum symbiosum (strain A) TaxID=414004 RepID=A0RVV1_CENSY|nr:hypothetical protein CENSYa_0835 [Cenarchaeum symbiosum A]